MSEQTQLILLKSKLKKIRSDKKNATIISWVIGVIIVMIVWGLLDWKGSLITDLWFIIIWVIIGVTGRLTVTRLYNAKEAQIISQIKQLTRNSSPENNI